MHTFYKSTCITLSVNSTFQFPIRKIVHILMTVEFIDSAYFITSCQIAILITVGPISVGPTEALNKNGAVTQIVVYDLLTRKYILCLLRWQRDYRRNVNLTFWRKTHSQYSYTLYFYKLKMCSCVMEAYINKILNKRFG